MGISLLCTKPTNVLYVSNYSGTTRMKIRSETSKALKICPTTVDNIWSKRQPSLKESRKITILLISIVCSDEKARELIDEVVLYRLVMTYFSCLIPEEDARKETERVFDEYMLKKCNCA
ncbi:MAG: hypothetical protein IKV85_06335 [Ruminococcus sp.]|nr:hypothetical protein [Ruminococcus sp.]